MTSSRPQDRPGDLSASLAEPRESVTSPIGDPKVTLAPGSCNDEHLVRGLVSYTSESAEQNRFPMQYARAFCHTTGDWRLLTHVMERSGLTAMTAEQVRVYELGRQVLLQKRAAVTVAQLEKELEGGAL